MTVDGLDHSVDEKGYSIKNISSCSYGGVVIVEASL